MDSKVAFIVWPKHRDALLRQLMLGLTLAAFVAHTTPLAAATTAAGHERAIDAVRAELEQRAKADQFSGTVLVAHQGAVLLEAAYGQANRAAETAMTVDTRLNFGSLGKMFTGVAVLQLVQAGKLKLDATVGDYLPDYPSRSVAAVTVHQLLTHTGGTGNIFTPEFFQDRARFRTLQDYVAAFGERDVAFEPGSKWEYSNYGFILLGRIVEVVSGQTYEDYVRAQAFARAGMTSTDNVEALIRKGPVALSYTGGLAASATANPGKKKKGAPKSDAGPRRLTDSHPIRGTAAGGGYTTVRDLWRFAEALRSHRLLDAHHTTLLLTGKESTPRPGSRYAYGFGDDALPNEVRRVGHTGGAPGVNAVLAMYPKTGHVVAILANIDAPAALEAASFIAEQLPLANGN